MLVAMNEKKQIINLLENTAPQGSFCCPGCGGAVRLKKRKIMRPHFAHISLKDCAYYSENESDQHLMLKSSLYSWLNAHDEVELEKCLPDLGQVADLLVNHRLALEVQCSSLSISRLQARTKSYQEAGVQVLWLLGKELWLGKRLTKLQEQFLSFSYNMGFYLWELDDKKNELRLHYLIHQDLRGRLQYVTKRFPFHQGRLLTILRSPYAQQRPASFEGRQDRTIASYIARQLKYRNPYWMQLQAVAYAQGENLLSKSVTDFYPQIRLPQSEHGFAQIHQDLAPVYQAFEDFYQQQKNKDQQVLVPPSVYLNRK
ncbi:competence protein CoiA [Streptococcus oriscaviae]|uniref:Competence protein CoiA n=1 Tax=Streptococcus oriscaviae TaxID=2781599 RepID=A0ABX7YMA8_9STRE|nr:competence protein CoiA family protein [Streptococcus oriscaviae]QUE54830.1 competence protein CoiA [Streptococcus oriscaviae]